MVHTHSDTNVRGRKSAPHGPEGHQNTGFSNSSMFSWVIFGVSK